MAPHRALESERRARTSLTTAWTNGPRYEGEDVLIYGSSGVGKTTTTRHFLSRKLPTYSDAAWAEIHCGDKTRNMLLKEAAAEHPDDVAGQLNWKPSRLKAVLEAIVDPDDGAGELG